MVKKKRVVRRKQPASIVSDEIFIPNHSGMLDAGKVHRTPTDDLDPANKKYVDDVDTANSATDQAYTDSEQGNHDIADHNDTSATGAELDTLTDNSMADTLHRHSELSASDGTPDQALVVDAAGVVTITSGTDYATLGFPSAQMFEIKGKPPGVGSNVVIDGAYNIQFQINNANRMQVNNTGVGIGIAIGSTSALLDLTSTTGALLLTRMTTAQRDALTAVNGMILYNTTLSKVQVYEGGAWASVI